MAVLDSSMASSLSVEKYSIPALQSKMKRDPQGYETEFQLLYRHFESSLDIFHQRSAICVTSVGNRSNSTTSKELGDLVMFLAHVTPLFPNYLHSLCCQVTHLLQSSARSLPSMLRYRFTQALILLSNRKVLDLEETLELFMELQTLGDKELRRLMFQHVVHNLRRMNMKHKNEVKNRKFQNILFQMLEGDNEVKVKRSLITLCELYRRRIWFDERTANAICTACFHMSSRIMISALKFLLGCERIEDDDSDDESNTDDDAFQNSHVLISREVAYKAHNKGTVASRKKKVAKLQRVVRSMRRQQRLSSGSCSLNYNSPLNNLTNAQNFAERLFSRLQSCNERFEVKMMMLKVIARTIGLHHLLLLNFYPFIQKYCQPHQRDVTNILAASVQACHEMVPPDVVEPLFKQLLNQFVHDRSRTEAVALGLNVVREMCIRMPLLMTEDVLQDLVLYKKSHDKAVCSAARALMMLFREICPSLLVKKDRGRARDPKAKPKAFGEVRVATDVPGRELMNFGSELDLESSDDATPNGSFLAVESSHSECETECGSHELEEGSDDNGSIGDEKVEMVDDNGVGLNSGSDIDGEEEQEVERCEKGKTSKRKCSGHDGPNDTDDRSLRALKRLAKEKLSHAPASVDASDGVLSNEDFQRIKDLKARTEANIALKKQGLLRKQADCRMLAFKLPSPEQLRLKCVDAAKLEASIRRKLSKDERVAFVKAGRENREKYQARTALKQRKTGGLSNRQKEHRKLLPLAAKRAKVARSQKERKKRKRRSSKQFRGRKAKS